MSFSGTFKTGDLAVLAAIALIAWLWASSGGGDSSAPESLRIVTAAGEDTLDLFSDTLFHRGAVTIEIRNGRAAITDSDCPTRQCVNTGWLSETGGISACMPNGVFIEVLGGGVATDAVTY